MRREFILAHLILVPALTLLAFFWQPVLWFLIALIPLSVFGWIDFLQTKQTIRRNFPLAGRLRYILEAIRPEINQYFIESNTEGRPFSREQRSVVYQRAKSALDTIPFGTLKDVYEPGYEWFTHSFLPVHVDIKNLRVTIGEDTCKQAYEASLLNISALSYGSLSKNAIMSLNKGAKLGGFAHNTGEGGISPYHTKYEGDLIWQIGTGYFGCRNKDGNFCEKQFQEKSQIDQVKMIEIKISQGAKPGHGGILPGMKVHAEIAKIRGVEIGKDVISPPAHTAFSTPKELLNFIAKLRELSGGKPVGIKICLGRHREFFSLCLAMHQSGLHPDFIAVDGGEGGTGAAPLEFSNHLGSPGIDALIFVHNALNGFGLRKKIKIIASGKVTTGFDAVKRIALGADLLYSARGMMMALGCIQALRCNTNICPAGIATTDPNLVAGLVVKDKFSRVSNYHKETLESAAHLMGAMGLKNLSEIKPWHVIRRISDSEVKRYHELYDFWEEDCFLNNNIPEGFDWIFKAASPETFARKDIDGPDQGL